MTIIDTSAQADALCTVISVGFIAAAIPDYHPPEGVPIRAYVRTKSKKQSYIVYYDGIKDEEEDARHAELQTKLKALGLEIDDYFGEKQFAGDKRRAPVIFGQTDRFALQGDILENVRDLVNRLEEKVNGEKRIPLRGAYVGGLFTGVDTAELLDASILYCYPPKFRNYSENVEESYQGAKRVTEAVQDFLTQEFENGKCSRKGGSILRRANPLPERQPMPESTENANLFGSIHGMTQSIIHYTQNGDSSKINMELALSEDTSKVASCIPCSIFMWANGVPATATHFGRGDNWNFPLPIFEQIKKCTGPDDDWTLRGRPDVKNWMNLIWTSYDIGWMYLTRYFEKMGRNPSDALAHVLALKDAEKYAQIPLLFLEALTFESSFLDKMLNTLVVV